MKYPKIDTLYNRDKDTFRVIPSELRRPEFGIVKQWLVTEKIDGRNHRVMLFPDGHVEHRGRTDNAQFADFMLEGAREAVDDDLVREAIEPSDGKYPMTILYGELFGPKIQGGGKYSDIVDFNLFDVRIEDWWLEWDDVIEIAFNIGVGFAPEIGTLHNELPTCKAELMDLFGAWRCSCVAWTHKLSEQEPEGIVARTVPTLFNRKGQRVMWKLKLRDWE